MFVEDVQRAAINSRAFAAAVREVLPALSRFARRLTRDEIAGDDLVQDALTRAWAARAQFQQGSNFRAWLFKIAHNRFLSLTRQAWRSVEWDPDKHERLLTESGGQERALILLDLRRALAGMAESHREVIHLLYRDHLTTEEAAKALGIQSGAMRSRASRARTALQQHYAMDAIASVPEQAVDDAPPEQLRIAFEEDPRPVRIPVGDRRLYERWKTAGSGMIG